VVALFQQYGLLLVAVIIVTGELGLPTLVPGEIALLIAGSQFVHSVPALIAAAILFGALDIAATSTIHLAARTAGNRLLLRLLSYVYHDAEGGRGMIDLWRRRLGGRDSVVVLVLRMIPVLRLYASITTGLIRIRFRDFVVGAAPASLIWASIPLVAGYLMRDQIAEVEQQYGLITYVVVAGSVLMVLLVLAGGWIRRTNSPSARVRRIRLVVGMAAVSSVLARLLMLVVFSRGLLTATSSALTVWVTSASLVALGLLWVANHDIRGIHLHEHSVQGLGRYRGYVWVGLMLIFSAITAWGVTPHPALVLL
jgi:membrane protein DedA with SNARE-associated domain